MDDILFLNQHLSLRRSHAETSDTIYKNMAVQRIEKCFLFFYYLSIKKMYVFCIAQEYFINCHL